ncbi:TonB-dependent receptor [Arcicella aquatica]|uniref:TonB-dependent receptor n=1 Tax=Arcicella aquatica TaxID=217141 RepID=A0ABU5QM56_9BACT|nr:TonB-dependent receptor [Arcicella aquatica]MEA5258142.1 TonB-dependent receptor [Arcicella aquatica]
MKCIITLLFIYNALNVFGQQKHVLSDSLKTSNLNEVVVTATRNERALNALPMPVTLIGQKQIRAMGSLRLSEVLAEQTGLFIVNDHGQGLQVQGFSPDYTLILLDGEPLVGRTAGTLELSRLAVANIKQIEIVKGPSSSLYGSEALAGVVNIITERPNGTKGSFSARYGTNQTTDLSGNMSIKTKKSGFNLFLNRYASGGYDFTPETFGQTVSPFQNYTITPKFTYDFSKNVSLNVSTRYNIENQESSLLVGTDQIVGTGSVKDWNFNPSLRVSFHQNLKAVFRFYNTQYKTNSELLFQKDNNVYDATYFNQKFLRPEVQVDYAIGNKQVLTLGAGKIWESVAATRYDDVKRFETNYGFFQYENLLVSALNLTIGGRFDAHSAYKAQFSPKVSVAYDLSKKVRLNGSIGVGFKAPDFRQLYLNFTNAVAGYSVFGTQEVALNLARLQAENQIAEVLFDVSKLGELKAESSLAFNFGGKIDLDNGLKFKANVFRNDISNLIQTQAVALKTNGQSVFSYMNLTKAFTQGIELDASYTIANNKSPITLSAGYQFLEAKDKDIVDKIARGELFRRDPETLVTVRVKASDYEGLFNRSRHSANIKVFYEDMKSGLTASLRGIYRSRYGFADYNGNGIADVSNEFVNGYILWNVSASKTFQERFRLQAGVDNVLGYTDTRNIPNLAGRLIWVSLGINLEKHKITEQ